MSDINIFISGLTRFLGWLASTGRHERGKKVLKYINGKVPDYDVEHECMCKISSFFI